MNRYKYFVGTKYQRVHSKFIHSILGGDFVECPSDDVRQKEFSQQVLTEDGEDVTWFFNDIFENLHPLLKGKQVLVEHGLGFKPILKHRWRVDTINQHFDRVFGTGKSEEAMFRKEGVDMSKYRQIGYTTLFQIPNIPIQKNSVLFISTCFFTCEHYKNLRMILKRLPSSISGYLTIHPQTGSKKKKYLLDACVNKKNIQYIESQEELLKAFAFCEKAITGGPSSASTPFFFQKKPVIFLQGLTSGNPFKAFSWKSVEEEVGSDLFSQVLKESTKLSHWLEFNTMLLKRAKWATSSENMFYSWNQDKQETIGRIRSAIQELEDSKMGCLRERSDG